jgi:hypothetical protein
MGSYPGQRLLIELVGHGMSNRLHLQGPAR